ncbi:MAG: phosphoribosyltransferase domain-containing protein [Actinobacteria bacterium]|nr:phosphoribosyltransferase domain-containing protein [Actinomycetota bacterium]
MHVDVEKLLESEEFQRRCEEMAARLATLQIDRIICPAHQCARAIAAFLAKQLQVPYTPVDEDTLLSRAGTPPLSEVRRGSRILVVDDVVITGHRLTGYQRALHDAGLVGHAGGVELTYAVAVARPPSTTAMQGIRDMVPPGRFFAAAEFLLPDWQDERDCPWCVELRLLESHAALVDRHATLAARKDVLLDRSTGLWSDLFLPWGQGSSAWPSHPAETLEEWNRRFEWLERVEPRFSSRLSWDLGPGSVFGAPSEIGLYVTIAGAVQALRSSGELHADDYQTPLSKVLDPYLYLRGRFYDPIVIASILRASQRHDLRATRIEKLLRRATGEKLFYGVYSELRSELVFAMSTGKLPRPYEVGTKRAELFSSAQPGIGAFLQSILAGRPGE